MLRLLLAFMLHDFCSLGAVVAYSLCLDALQSALSVAPNIWKTLKTPSLNGKEDGRRKENLERTRLLRGVSSCQILMLVECRAIAPAVKAKAI